MILNTLTYNVLTLIYLSKDPCVLDDSKIRSLILSISVTLCLATRHVYISRQMPAFFKYTLGNTYMLYIFDMAIDPGHILEQAGSDTENWL